MIRGPARSGLLAYAKVFCSSGVLQHWSVALSPFWRGGTSDASKFHGSDGAASAPRLSIHLSRCGLAFTRLSRDETPVASWCSMVQRCDNETSASRFARDV